ncbi:ribosome assembly protein 1 [Paragonimus westermani]|uniref:Ribosome assembly protein 1 n=1 Tax=Paragonimus westermani TaxID=34504 RepID=A0A5J4NF70_9TREM|nr:ribosome assembly protein 1 [Paragonimus westermani]
MYNCLPRSCTLVFCHILRLSQLSDSMSCTQHMTYDLIDPLEGTDDSHLYFSPDRGNVVFASAVDTWGFRPMDVLPTWSKRLDVSVDELKQVIWGDFYISRAGGSRTGKTIFKQGAHTQSRKPVFVQLVLDSLWKAYQTLVVDGCQEELANMASKLGVQLDPRAVRNTDSRGMLRALLSAWLPLGKTLLQTITDICPSPVHAVSADRAVHMLYGDQVSYEWIPSGTSDSAAASRPGESVSQISRLALDPTYAKSGASLAIQQCRSSPDAPTIVFVAKVFWTDKLQLSNTRPPKADIKKNQDHGMDLADASPRVQNTHFWKASMDVPIDVPDPAANNATHGASVPVNANKVALLRAPLSATNPLTDVEFVALARVFSGSVYAGQRLFVLGPKFNGSKVPSYLLDADPADFPIGPLRLRTDEEDREPTAPGSLLTQPDEPFASSPVASSIAAFSRSGSVGGSSGGLCSRGMFLRHVYVAAIVSVLRCLGGQHDLQEATGPVPSGNIVGLTGPDLISFLPKSGMLVSRLSLVAGVEQSGVLNAPVSASVLPLAGLAVWHGAPVISVAVEPASAANPEDVYRLERGLRLLDRADPCAEVSIAPTGEYLIKAAGEVHLQKCLEDINKYFAPDLELQISPFVVPFRETVTESSPSTDRPLSSIANESYEKACRKMESICHKLNVYYQNKHSVSNSAKSLLQMSGEPVALLGDTTCTQTEEKLSTAASETLSHRSIVVTTQTNELPDRSRTKRELLSVDVDLCGCPVGFFQLPHSKTQTRVLVRVTAHPLPEMLVHWAESRGSRKIPQLIRAFKTKSVEYGSLVSQFSREFNELCSVVADEQPDSSAKHLDWKMLAHSFLALGPNQVGPNMLFSRLQTDCFPVFTAWGQNVCSSGENLQRFKTKDRGISLPLISYGKALLRGFQLATEHGPLCGEPMRGVLFILEEICAEDCRFLEAPKLCSGPAQEVVVELNHVTESKEVEHAVTTASKQTELTNLTAKVEAISRRRKGRRLTSVSWLDEFEQNDEEEEDFYSDIEADWGWESGDNESDHAETDRDQSSSETEDVEDKREKSDATEALLEKDLKDIPYWKRRTDTDWLYDASPGLLTSAMNRACLAAFQASPSQRLMLAMYDVELQARRDVLGRMFGVLRKRHGRISSEDFREGENTFVICARLPVIESFGLADELRSRTSGVVSLPQLRPGGWELLDIDPVARDGELSVAMDKCLTMHDAHVERANKKTAALPSSKFHRVETSCSKGGKGPVPLGGDSDDEVTDELTAQVARVRSYIKQVRLRKGLPTNEQLVLYADKQRTLKRNK